MLLQATALALLAVGDGAIPTAAAAAVLLGFGTALVYPTLIAAFGLVAALTAASGLWVLRDMPARAARADERAVGMGTRSR